MSTPLCRSARTGRSTSGATSAGATRNPETPWVTNRRAMSRASRSPTLPHRSFTSSSACRSSTSSTRSASACSCAGPSSPKSALKPRTGCGISPANRPTTSASRSMRIPDHHLGGLGSGCGASDLAQLEAHARQGPTRFRGGWGATDLHAAHCLVEAAREGLGVPFENPRAMPAGELGGVIEEQPAEPLPDERRLEPQVLELRAIIVERDAMPAEHHAIALEHMHLMGRDVVLAKLEHRSDGYQECRAVQPVLRGPMGKLAQRGCFLRRGAANERATGWFRCGERAPRAPRARRSS